MSAEQGCTPLVAYLVPKSAFASVAPSQKLSSYFAPKGEVFHSAAVRASLELQDPKAGEFTNANAAIVPSLDELRTYSYRLGW